MSKIIIAFVYLFIFFSFDLGASSIKEDETVVFFPALAQKTNDVWKVEIHGWIFEPERRSGAATLFRKYVGIDDDLLTDDEKSIFRKRTKLFLVDAEHGKQISIRLGEKVFPMEPSDPNGRFHGRLQLTEAEWAGMKTNSTGGQVLFRAVLAKGDQRDFSGRVHLISETGLSIISDIDDTIKISEVRDRNKLLRNTFFREFQPAPGMSELYREWATNDAVAFHYVSASPCQLYPALADFISTNKFPVGTVHLRVFDWRDAKLHKAVAEVSPFKAGVIEPLLKRYPHRQFILVGDSGEHDPEIYGAIARKFSGQIQRILIRDVTSDDLGRYRKCFESIPDEKWQIFKFTSEIRR